MPMTLNLGKTRTSFEKVGSKAEEKKIEQKASRVGLRRGPFKCFWQRKRGAGVNQRSPGEKNSLCFQEGAPGKEGGEKGGVARSRVVGGRAIVTKRKFLEGVLSANENIKVKKKKKKYGTLPGKNFAFT